MFVPLIDAQQRISSLLSKLPEALHTRLLAKLSSLGALAAVRPLGTLKRALGNGGSETDSMKEGSKRQPNKRITVAPNVSGAQEPDKDPSDTNQKDTPPKSQEVELDKRGQPPQQEEPNERRKEAPGNSPPKGLQVPFEEKIPEGSRTKPTQLPIDDNVVYSDYFPTKITPSTTIAEGNMKSTTVHEEKSGSVIGNDCGSRSAQGSSASNDRSDNAKNIDSCTARWTDVASDKAGDNHLITGGSSESGVFADGRHLVHTRLENSASDCFTLPSEAGALRKAQQEQENHLSPVALAAVGHLDDKVHGLAVRISTIFHFRFQAFGENKRVGFGAGQAVGLHEEKNRTCGVLCSALTRTSHI